MQNRMPHQAVLLQEAIAALAIRPQGAYIDATFGRGGHARAILTALGSQGRLLALDRDPAAEQYAREHFQDTRFSFVRSSFAELAAVAKQYGWLGQVAGILLDLGVSTPQLDAAERGFSFTKDGPLDMRMDPTQGSSAAEWLARASEAELAQVLKDFGEERYSRRIARAIVAARRAAPIETTGQLAGIIASAVPTREPGKHPATRSFQAIRILINQELAQLEAALVQALQVLAAGGRLVVISFHSLEDRLVKRFMRREAQGEQWPLDLPVLAAQSSGATLRVIGRALRPGAPETTANPRARSAVLRVAERLA